ncbi:MAG: hypothetical protein V4444_08875 [Pseudomonadota bacterium]
MRGPIILGCGLALSGCVVSTIARTAVDIVTLPVKVVSATVDAATTSQAEADQNAGRKLRKEQEEAGRKAREAEKRCKSLAARGGRCPPPPEAPQS